MQFVFAYGSLAADLRGSHPAVLRGRRRGWGVAMDNRVDVPGYKHYRLRADGSRPAVFVAFLDLFEDAAAETHGICVPVDDAAAAGHRPPRAQLRAHRRDRRRHAAAPRHRVGLRRRRRPAARRLERARADGAAVVSRDYLERTRAAFAALGPAALADFEAERRGRRPAGVGPPALRELD